MHHGTRVKGLGKPWMPMTGALLSGFALTHDGKVLIGGHFKELTI